MKLIAWSIATCTRELPSVLRKDRPMRLPFFNTDRRMGEPMGSPLQEQFATPGQGSSQ
jgi:hypothetical protein